MAKWYGMIGYGKTEETTPSVHVKKITKRLYSGDILQNSRRLESSGNINDDINITNRISIVADPFAYENFHNIIFAEYMGINWKVKSVRVMPPRLELTLGEVYNGPTT